VKEERQKEVDDWTREELQKEYIEEMTAVTVPVNVSIHGQQTVLDMSSVENILRSAEIITVEDCGCRIKWHTCDAPLDAVSAWTMKPEKP